MSISEIIKTGRKYRVCYDSTPGAKKWYRLSHWTHASDVEFDDQKKLSDVLATNTREETTSIIRYVNQNGGSDNNDGKSENTPYLTIQRAIDDAPLVIGNTEFIIKVKGGTSVDSPMHYHNFVVKNTSITLEIDGNIVIGGTALTNSSECLIEVDSATLKVISKNGLDDSRNPKDSINVHSENNYQKKMLIYVHNGGMVNVYQTTLRLIGNGSGDNGSTGIYVVSNGGFASTTSNISFRHVMSAVRVSTNSNFYADGLYENKDSDNNSNIKYGIICSNGGQVAYGINNIAVIPGGVLEQTSNGGRIYTGSQ